MGYIYHKDYKTCTECGANLDPEEKCDCEEQVYIIGIDTAEGKDMTAIV